MRFYLGSDDTFSLQRQIDECYQGEDESIVQFISRMLKLIRMQDPNKSEEQAVMTIKNHLRAYYQRQLAPFRIVLLDDLNDKCLGLEASSASTKLAPILGHNINKQGIKTDRGLYDLGTSEY